MRAWAEVSCESMISSVEMIPGKAVRVAASTVAAGTAPFLCKASHFDWIHQIRRPECLKSSREKQPGVINKSQLSEQHSPNYIRAVSYPLFPSSHVSIPVVSFQDQRPPSHLYVT